MTETVCYHCLESPIGTLLLTSDGHSLTGLHMVDPPEVTAVAERAGWKRDNAPFGLARNQLNAYFAGDLVDFTLPLRMEGTPFQRLVWRELCNISYGGTISYRELAGRVGNPRASRAVGSANGKNPIAVIVPCHRVIAADGTLGGYGGGLDRKRWLLEHEAAVLARHG